MGFALSCAQETGDLTDKVCETSTGRNVVGDIRIDNLSLVSIYITIF